MNQQRSLLILILLLVAAIAVIGGFYTANVRFIEGNPGGNDFLVHWVGARSFLIDGVSPYSDSVAREIQEIAYGRPARPGEHELRVAYPFYSVAVFAPFALISDFATARAVWMTVLEIALIAFALVAVRLTNWKPGTLVLAVFMLFALVWYHAVRPLILGNAVILVSLLVAGALLAIRNGRDELAGFLLAVATIKPQVVALVYLFILIWGLSHRRWLLVGWMVGGVAFLTGVGMIFLPNWILQNLWEILRYPGYNPPGTIGAAFDTWMPAIGSRLGLAFTVLFAVVLLLEWRAAAGKDFRWFLWTASLTLVVSGWIGIQTDPGNFIAMLPALVFIFAVWDERWSSSARVATLFSMLVLFVGIWWLFLTTVGEGGSRQQHPIMFFPLPLFLLVGLYWVRWAVVQPMNLWLDRMRARENP